MLYRRPLHTADSSTEAAAQSHSANRMPPATKLLVWPGTWGCFEESPLCAHITLASYLCDASGSVLLKHHSQEDRLANSNELLHYQLL